MEIELLLQNLSMKLSNLEFIVKEYLLWSHDSQLFHSEQLNM